MFSLTSMTGFGQAHGESTLGRFEVELRTVNSRFQDISVTLPRELSALEMPVRLLLKQQIPRGRVDCRVRFTPSSEAAPLVSLNLDLIRAWLTQLRELKTLGLDEEPTVGAILNLPGVLQNQNTTINEAELFEQLRPVVQRAIDALNLERRREGMTLGRDLETLVGQLENYSQQVEMQKDQVVNRYRERLRERIAELESDLKLKMDTGRIEMEVALFADRVDITEELARLKAHFKRFHLLLMSEQNEPAGKNIEFLLQEIGREINTLCSKTRDTDVIGIALEMKAVLERLKEQSANIQ